MKLIDEETRSYLMKEVPEFVEAIKTAQEDDIDTVLFMLDAFAGEPELLYKVVWLAYSQGVSITMVPKQNDKPKKN